MSELTKDFTEVKIDSDKPSIELENLSSIDTDFNKVTVDGFTVSTESTANQEIVINYGAGNMGGLLSQFLNYDNTIATVITGLDSLHDSFVNQTVITNGLRTDLNLVDGLIQGHAYNITELLDRTFVHGGRLNQLDQNVAATGQAMTLLGSELTGLKDDYAVVNGATNTLFSELDILDGKVTAKSGEITNLFSQLNGLNNQLGAVATANSELGTIVSNIGNEYQAIAHRTDKLSAAYGGSTNILPNSEFASKAVGWVKIGGTGGFAPSILEPNSPTHSIYIPPEVKSLWSSGNCNIGNTLTVQAPVMPVKENEWYGISGYTGGRNVTSSFYYMFKKKDGTVLDDGWVPNPGPDAMNSQNLKDYKRCWKLVQAPAGTDLLEIRWIATCVTAGLVWTYVFRPMVERGWEGQTQPSEWVSNIGGALQVTADAVESLTVRVETTEDTILSEATKVVELQASVNILPDVYLQPTQPTTPRTGTTFKVGDMWIDSDNGNQVSVWDGSMWGAVVDLMGATIYAQPNAPSVGGLNVGDLWFDTDDGNKQYRWNGTQWLEVTDNRIAATAAATAVLTSRVTATENSIGTVSENVTNLSGEIHHGTTGLAATKQIADSVKNRVDNTGYGKNIEQVAEESRLTTLKVNDGNLGLDATRSKTDNLINRVNNTGAGKTIEQVNTDLYALSLAYNGPNGISSKASQTDFSELLQRVNVTPAGTSIEQMSTSLRDTVLQVNDVNTGLNSKASQSNFTLLQNRVNNTGTNNWSVEQLAQQANTTKLAVDHPTSGINSKVSQGTFDNLYNRVQNTGNGLTIEALSSKAQTTEAAFNNMRIGVTNLINSVGSNPAQHNDFTWVPQSLSKVGWIITGGYADWTLLTPLKPNTPYSLSFKAYQDAPAGGFSMDLFPDTLPETYFNVTSGMTEYKWENITANHADMAVAKLRLFNVSSSTPIVITDLMLVEGTKAVTWQPNQAELKATVNSKASTSRMDSVEYRLNDTGAGRSFETLVTQFDSARNAINDPTTGLASKSSASDFTTLKNRVDTAGGGIENIASRTSTIEGSVNNPTTGLSAVGSIANQAVVDIRQSAANQLKNPTGAEGTKYWMQGGSVAFSGPVVNSWFGTAWYVPPTTGNQWAILGQNIPAGHGQTWCFSVMANSPADAGGHVYISIQAFDASDNLIGTEASAHAAAGGQVFSVVRTIPAGTAYGRVNMVCYNTGGNYFWLAKANIGTTRGTYDDAATLSATVSQTDALNLAVGGVNGAATNSTSLTYKMGQMAGYQQMSLDINGYVSGMWSQNNGLTSSVKFRTDLFEIGSPGGGARTEFSNGNWRIYDASNVLRVKMGVW